MFTRIAKAFFSFFLLLRNKHAVKSVPDRFVDKQGIRNEFVSNEKPEIPKGKL